MTRLEKLKRCAELMGLRYINPAEGYDGEIGIMLCGENGMPTITYEPDRNAAQAFELQDKLRLHIEPWKEGKWVVSQKWDVHTEHADLKTAIVDCAAKIQSTKE